MFTIRVILFFLVATLSDTLAVLAKKKPSAIVPLMESAKVDLIKYSGRWYELARLPARFERNCYAPIVANYSLLPSGEIEVINTCATKQSDKLTCDDVGERCLSDRDDVSITKGVARKVSQPSEDTMLEVNFVKWLKFLPFTWANYHILAITPDYKYALIGTKGQKYLWILGRSATKIDYTVIAKFVSIAKQNGYKVENLIYQSGVLPR